MSDSTPRVHIQPSPPLDRAKELELIGEAVRSQSNDEIRRTVNELVDDVHDVAGVIERACRTYSDIGRVIDNRFTDELVIELGLDRLNDVLYAVANWINTFVIGGAPYVGSRDEQLAAMTADELRTETIRLRDTAGVVDEHAPLGDVVVTDDLLPRLRTVECVVAKLCVRLSLYAAGIEDSFSPVTWPEHGLKVNE